MKASQLIDIRSQFKKDIGGSKDLKTLQKVRIHYLERKGILAPFIKELHQLSQEERSLLGSKINELKSFITKELRKRGLKLQTTNHKLQNIDFTLPGKKVHRGHLHPLSLIQEEIASIFHGLNFSLIEGPEVETEWYNFDALNFPLHHPARDLWDTFWLQSNQGQKLLLRTHTSPMQVRYMETHQPPLRIVVPGRVFRYEASDATHDLQFYQLEGLLVDREVSVANFKAVIELFFKKLFEKEFGGIRLRPSYFPFTEPSFEVDFYWKSKEKWLEIMGAGMVHSKIFEAAGFAAHEWQGFAFGLGIDRVAMLKYKIPDIRMFYSGDLRVIRQF